MVYNEYKAIKCDKSLLNAACQHWHHDRTIIANDL